MRHRSARSFLLLALLGAGLTPTLGAEHLMVVQEVFPGTPEQPTAQYVMLRMTSSGQTLLNTRWIEVQDASGAVLGRFGTIDHNVATGGTLGCVWPNCPAVLIGTSAAQTLLGFAFDQIVDSQAGRVSLPLSGGRVCFQISTATGPPDCVAYGAYTAPNTVPSSGSLCDTNFGTPAAALSLGSALTRVSFNCVNKENSTDFQNRFPHPVNNALVNANTDLDADGLISVLDCADNDNTSLYAPIEVSRLDVIGGHPPVLSWTFPTSALLGTSTRYDVAGAFPAQCVASQANALSALDPTPDPPPGGVFFYKVRARNNCGKGTYGAGLFNNPLDDPCP